MAGLQLQRGPVALHRLLDPAQLKQQSTEVAVALGAGRIEFQGTDIKSEGFAAFPEIAQHVEGVHVGGVELERPPVVADGFLAAPEGAQRVGQVAQNLRIRGLELERPSIAIDRRTMAAKLQMRVAQVVVGLRRPRIERQRPLIERHGLGGSSQRSQGIGRIDERLHVIGLHFKPLAQARQRLRPLRAVVQRRAQVALRLGVLRQ